MTNADLFTRIPTGNAASNVLSNDKAPTGAPLTVATIPVTATANGTFTYIPNAGYTGPYQFVYQICDDLNPKGSRIYYSN